jgi:hypothetical protein
MDKFIVSYDDENGILYLKIKGLLEVGDLRDLILKYEKLLEGKPRRYALVDMTESAKFDTSVMTKELRNSYKDMIKAMNPDKTAIFGASPALRMTSRIALVVSGKSDVTHFFKTKEEAMEWLKGGKRNVGSR